MKVIGLVGLRSGSKSIPHKNLISLNGRPLFTYINECAKKSINLTHTYFSTDSPDYIKILEGYGISTLLRPESYATDLSPEFAFIKHHVNNDLDLKDGDIVVRMHATSPLQLPSHIDRCVECLAADNKLDSAVLVRQIEYTPNRLLSIVDTPVGQRLEPFTGGDSRGVTPGPRQSEGSLYVRANVIACRVATIRETHSLTGLNCAPIINADPYVDINSEEDLKYAEFLLANLWK